MSFWLSVTKAVLPYTNNIISFLIPIFNRSKEHIQEVQAENLQQQVSEIKEKSFQNAEEIKILADKIESILPFLEQKDKSLVRLRRSHLLCNFVVAIALLTLAGGFFMNFSR